jgi:hypothetical protein
MEYLWAQLHQRSNNTLITIPSYSGDGMGRVSTCMSMSSKKLKKNK